MDTGLFFILAYATAWAFFLTAGATDIPELRSALFLVGAFMPALVALWLTAQTEGRAAAGALLRRVVAWRVDWRLYLLAAGYPAAIKLAVALVHRLAVGTWPRFDGPQWYLIILAIFAATPSKAGEEIGWRGYALPRLASRLGLRWSSVWLGATCWCGGWEPRISSSGCRGGTRPGSRQLFENQVRNVRFHVPVNHRERRQVERSVPEHRNPDPTGGGEDRAEHESCDRCLFGAGQPLVRVVGQREDGGREQHDPNLGPDCRSEELAQPLEQIPSEHRLFPEPRDEHGPHRGREHGPVSPKVMVRLIDRRGAEERHDDRFHHELERDAASDAEGEASNPAPGLCEADLMPRRPGPSGPREYEQAADWHSDATDGNRPREDDDQHRNDVDRPNAAPRHFKPSFLPAASSYGIAGVGA